MQTPYRLLVFGLPRGTTQEDLCALAGSHCVVAPQVLDLPGDNDQSMAVMEFYEEVGAVRRKADRIGRQVRGGHHLQTWLCVMPWH